MSNLFQDTRPSKSMTVLNGLVVLMLVVAFAFSLNSCKKVPVVKPPPVKKTHTTPDIK